MTKNKAICDVANITPPGIDNGYLIEPAYAESRGWGSYYFNDDLTYELIEALVPEFALTSGIYIKCTRMDTHETTKISGVFRDFWDFIVTINSSRCCIFDAAYSFLLTVIEADVSTIASDRTLLQEIFGASDTSAAEWIEETRHFKPDLRAEILAKYVPGA